MDVHIKSDDCVRQTSNGAARNGCVRATARVKRVSGSLSSILLMNDLASLVTRGESGNFNVRSLSHTQSPSSDLVKD